ncbi:hypothetical protein ACTXT7_010524 [Hymenolepis weldensis]
MAGHSLHRIRAYWNRSHGCGRGRYAGNHCKVNKWLHLNSHLTRVLAQVDSYKLSLCVRPHTQPQARACQFSARTLPSRLTLTLSNPHRGLYALPYTTLCVLLFGIVVCCC